MALIRSLESRILGSCSLSAASTMYLRLQVWISSPLSFRPSLVFSWSLCFRPLK
eukprot:03430.XXX_89290_89451_1 [CDS] Oithona nana genome sequencing.